MRITQTVNASLNKTRGDTYTINGIASIVTYAEAPVGEDQVLTLMIHGKSEIKLPFTYASTDPTRIGLDTSGNISLTSITPVMGILRACDIDENGAVIPKNAGDLHGCFWFGGCH